MAHHFDWIPQPFTPGMQTLRTVPHPPTIGRPVRPDACHASTRRPRGPHLVHLWTVRQAAVGSGKLNDRMQRRTWGLPRAMSRCTGQVSSSGDPALTDGLRWLKHLQFACRGFYGLGSLSF